MISLEPFTMRGIGSPQLFQTGESYQRRPLIDRQHPHDLFMELGATYRLTRPRRTTIILSADLVGPAALGPTPFMHRESARNNPQAPLTHHSTRFHAHHARVVLTRRRRGRRRDAAEARGSAGRSRTRTG